MLPLVLVLVLVLVASSSATLLPLPKGPFSVARHVLDLTNTSRDSCGPSGQPLRRILASLFVPVDSTLCQQPLETVPYLTPAVAAFYAEQAGKLGLPGDKLASLEMQFCNPLFENSTRARDEKFPLVILTPSLGDSRLLYSAMARSLASMGYAVATVDHPYETGLVEFPDGTEIRAANISYETPGALEAAVQVRRNDLAFLLDVLSASPADSPLQWRYFSRSVDVEKTVVVGHSVGGVAAAVLVQSDARLVGGVNFDGSLQAPAEGAIMSKPFMLAGRPDHNSVDETWERFWPSFAGPSIEVLIDGVVHGSFNDIPLLVSAMQLPQATRQELGMLVGTMEAARLDEVLNGLLTSFFALAMDAEAGPLRAINATFPEISVERSSLPV